MTSDDHVRKEGGAPESIDHGRKKARRAERIAGRKMGCSRSLFSNCPGRA